MPVPDVTAVVLAAGSASRFGGPKQLEHVGGIPMVVRAVQAAAHPEVGRVLVTVGASAGDVEQALTSADVTVVPVPDWQLGMGRSLAAAASAARRGQALLVLLADQPGVTLAATERVLARRDPALDAVRASYGGRAGHPVLLEPHVVLGLNRLTGDVGARDLLAGLRVGLVACDDVADGTDVDHPRDLSRHEDAGLGPDGS